ncbi:MAG: sodium-dependent bicarbonate transport family permease [Phycisphaeraceae bacterium]|nr:sodium-dependent bicarbonate transport family permease [Phycisphaeraceae bacterium]
MDATLLLQNVLSAPILFFALGILASLVRSNLAIPSAAAKVLSIYLLLAIGFHGGSELHRSGLDGYILLVLGVAVLASASLPVLGYLVLRTRLAPIDAAAVAACYGSVSAVTFITAISFLEREMIAYGGYMIAAMALMESPAIITAVLLVRFARRNEGPATAKRAPWSAMLHEALANGAILLLMGSLVIGYLSGEEGWTTMKPLIKDPFQAVLCLFLLDMGIVAARRIGDLRRSGVFLIGFALVAPLLQAGLGIVVAKVIGLSPGDALLLAVLFGSASYIAVPAALRLVLPKANPSLYVPMSLGLTFPLNITFGIPLYYAVIHWWWML